MKISKSLQGFIENAQRSDPYWVETAKLQFAMDLEGRRRASDMTYKAIAEKIGTSAAYITKIFRGDSNVTIESMVKLARATGGSLDIRIVDTPVFAHRWALPTLQPKRVPTAPARSSATSFNYIEEAAVNDRRFSLAA